MVGGLAKLELSPDTAVVLVIAIIAGGFINIPVKRIISDANVPVHPFAIFGVRDAWPQLRRIHRETTIAVNVGGCVIPTALAVYEIARLAALEPQALLATAAVAGINVWVCYRLARPVQGIGMVMPGLVSPLIAAGLAIALASEHAAPVAFVAGIAGPLIGADLFHLDDVRKNFVGMASIGGAGTFDGIVLSGIVAAYIA